MEGASIGGISMVPVTGDGNGGRGDNGMQPFLEGERGRRRGGSMVPEVDDTMKSGAVVGEAKGGGWHLGVEDDQRKLSWWTECAVEPNC